MAKKKVNQEPCMFCGRFPCECAAIAKLAMADVPAVVEEVAAPEGDGEPHGDS